eukprot:Skav232858  [mRNA]  locus=scaffold2451:97957:102459:- [translate_table: standard]
MDPLLSVLPPSGKFNLVVEIDQRQPGPLVRMQGLSPQQELCMWCEAGELEPGRYTCYNFVKSEAGSGVDCHFDHDSVMFPHNEDVDSIGFSIVEFCAGMGGFSLGSIPVGLKTAVMVDSNPLACRALKDNFTCPVIKGDVQDTNTMILIHEQRPEGRIQVTAGFACQPYSRQGDGNGLPDEPGSALHGIFRGAWWLHAQSLLLECEANVLNFPEVGAAINEYAETMGMNVTTLAFDLSDQWPMRRERYWCLLVSRDFPHIHLQPWPKSAGFSALSSIMPLDAVWEEDAEDELSWDPLELSVFFDKTFGLDQRILESKDIANTVLHSWGNLLRRCPCECRGPISESRLRRGGARGFGLVSASTGKVRHLHPAEGAMLCTVKPDYVFDMSPRAALCLLGQLAAPLQVLWIQSHVQKMLQEKFLGFTEYDPLDSVMKYQKSLLAQVRQTWITKSMSAPRQLSLEEDGMIYEIQVSEPISASMVLQAEQKLRGRGQLPRLFESGHRVNPDHLLHEDVIYQIRQTCARSCAALPCPVRPEAVHDLGISVVAFLSRALKTPPMKGTSSGASAEFVVVTRPTELDAAEAERLVAGLEGSGMASLAFGDGALPTAKVTLFGGKGGVGKPGSPEND